MFIFFRIIFLRCLFLKVINVVEDLFFKFYVFIEFGIYNLRSLFLG